MLEEIGVHDSGMRRVRLNSQAFLSQKILEVFREKHLSQLAFRVGIAGVVVFSANEFV